MADFIFGTDGIRSKVGTDYFTYKNLVALGNALAVWMQEKYGRSAHLLVAHDTRQSCGMVKATLKSQLLLHPISVYDAGVLPSPAVYRLMLNDTKFKCGLIISASHNPFSDNGIKLLDASQGKLSLEDEVRISELYAQEAREPNYTELGMDVAWGDGYHEYRASLLRLFPENIFSGLKVVLDCAHGASYKIAPDVFRQLGADVIALNAQPNGLNINKTCGAVFPGALQEAVVHEGADIGFAFDGDADRVMAVSKQGELKTGDDILALLLESPRYADVQSVVGTVMTNKGFEVHLEARGRKLIRSAVGDKYVASAMQQHKSILGGESSGHIILGDYMYTGDGLFTALRLLETIQAHQNWALQSFLKFPQVMINLPVREKRDLAQDPLNDIIVASQKQLKEGRILVRYSGTEPLLRIMVEDNDFDYATMVGNALSKKLASVIGT